MILVLKTAKDDIFPASGKDCGNMIKKRTPLFQTLLFKMIVIFFATSMVPACIVAIFIPSYYNKIMTENIDLLTNTVVNSAITNINTYIDDVERLLIAPYIDEAIKNSIYILKGAYGGKDVKEKDILEAKRILNRTLPGYTQYSRQDVVGTLLCFNDKNAIAIYHDGSNLVKNFDFGKETWYQRVYKEDGKTVFISTHTQDYLRHQENYQVFSVARLIKDLDTKQVLAIIKIDLDKNILSTIMKDIKLNVSSIMTVVDADGELLYANQEVDEAVKEALKEGGERIWNKGQLYRIISERVEETGWQIKALVSESEYLGQIHSMQQKVIGIYLVALAAAVCLYCYLSSHITKPLKVIARKMKEVENGNFEVRFHVAKNDEIAVLGNSFNLMTEHLNLLIDQKYKAVIAEQKARYHALQSQIEPHFIYNVLNSMVGINRMGDRKLLEETINSLAGILRYMTVQGDQCSVEEEFSVLQKYCSLQKLRLQNRLEYTIDIGDNVKSALIPKLLVQPLVENAIIHGIEPTGECGEISISVRADEDEMLEITVTDTGCGFDVDNTVKGNNPIALANIISRVRYMGEKAEVKINSEKGKGTSILLRIPQQKEENDDEDHCGR